MNPIKRQNTRNILCLPVCLSSLPPLSLSSYLSIYLSIYLSFAFLLSILANFPMKWRYEFCIFWFVSFWLAWMCFSGCGGVHCAAAGGAVLHTPEENCPPRHKGGSQIYQLYGRSNKRLIDVNFPMGANSLILSPSLKGAQVPPFCFVLSVGCRYMVWIGLFLFVQGVH